MSGTSKNPFTLSGDTSSKSASRVADTATSRARSGDLAKDGYTVLDTWCSADRDQLRKARSEFYDALKTFPEYKAHAPGQIYVRGGFAALGNPASFHNPFVRKLRQWAMAEVLQSGAMSPFTKQGRKLEQIIDRMMLRRRGTVVTGESWHRDEAPFAKAGDHLFGGWINLDEKPQYLSCVPGTHKEVKGHSGFNKLTNIERFDAQRKLVEVKPGQILLFYEHMIHEIMKGVDKQDDRLRVFLAWRATSHDEPLLPGLDGLLDSQAPMPLKSNQIPPMYPKLNWTNHRPLLVKFSDAVIKDQCREHKRVKSGPDAGKSYHVVHQQMRSLRAYGLPLYPPYAADERKMHKPSRSWELLQPGKAARKRKYRLD